MGSRNDCSRAQAELRFGGDTYQPELDGKRLGAQLTAVYELMQDGRARTLADISIVTGYPEASVSARLRDLRKPKFGGFIVERRRVGDPRAGLHTYRLIRAQP